MPFILETSVNKISKVLEPFHFQAHQTPNSMGRRWGSPTARTYVAGGGDGDGRDGETAQRASQRHSRPFLLRVGTGGAARPASSPLAHLWYLLGARFRPRSRRPQHPRRPRRRRIAFPPPPPRPGRGRWPSPHRGMAPRRRPPPRRRSVLGE